MLTHSIRTVAPCPLITRPGARAHKTSPGVCLSKFPLSLTPHVVGNGNPEILRPRASDAGWWHRTRVRVNSQGDKILFGKL